MNCLIVDSRTEERAEVLEEYLRSNGHQVLRHTDQLDALPGAPIPCPAWVELAQNRDIVFLHVGDYQRNALQFFAHVLPALPVFCYTGTAAPIEIAAQCSSPGIHVLCPDPTGTDAAAGQRLVAVVSRWLGCIEGRSDSGRFVDAWHRVRNLDVEKENSLQALENELGIILMEFEWTPEMAVTIELRDRLRTVKALRADWGL